MKQDARSLRLAMLKRKVNDDKYMDDAIEKLADEVAKDLVIRKTRPLHSEGGRG
jgi:hypothetical protein